MNITHKTLIVTSLALVILTGAYAQQAIAPLPQATAADRTSTRAADTRISGAQPQSAAPSAPAQIASPKPAPAHAAAPATTTQTQTAATAPSPAPIATAKIGTPTQLVIPSIGVNAHIQSVGLTSTGNMATAPGWEDVGWYDLGPLPGQYGSAVIAGHYETGPNVHGVAVPGVFQNLHSISLGDVIEVTDASGTTRRFTVTDKKVVDKDAQTADIFATEGPARVTLITCFGTWIPAQKTFSNRLIVTAMLAP